MRSRARVTSMLAPLTLGSALTLAGLSSSVPASADGSFLQYGWWTAANSVNGTDVTPAQAPDNADMHVSVGPVAFDDPYSITKDKATGPTELSAVRYQLPAALPAGTDPSTPIANFKVTVDANYPAVGMVAIIACKTLQSWAPEKSGNWSDRANYQQGGCSTGETHDAGKTYDFTFLATQLAADGRTVDMAIAPSLNPNTPPFKVWLTPPVSGDLTPMAAPSRKPSTVSVPQQPTTLASPVQPTGARGTTSPPVIAGGGYPGSTTLGGRSTAPVAPANQPVTPPSSASIGGPNTAVTATPLPVAGVTAGTERSRVIAGSLLLAVLLIGCAAVVRDLQRRLSPGGQSAGVGRFVRPRTGPPLPL